MLEIPWCLREWFCYLYFCTLRCRTRDCWNALDKHYWDPETDWEISIIETWWQIFLIQLHSLMPNSFPVLFHLSTWQTMKRARKCLGPNDMWCVIMWHICSLNLKIAKIIWVSCVKYRSGRRGNSNQSILCQKIYFQF